MLEVFAGRRTAGGLVQADASRAWPLRPGAAGLVFAARAAHLLDRRHLVTELTRALRPGGLVVLGRVQRQPDGLRARLRDHRRTLLAQQGVDPGGDGAQRGQKLLDDLVGLGGERLPTATAACWTVETDPAQVIANWRTGGRPTPAAVLDKVADCAPPQPETEEERYALDAVRIP